jgi:predicted metal-dependent hydrolase
VIEVEGLGPVVFKANPRCKRLSIRIKPGEGVLVAFPPGYSAKNAMNFVLEKRSWIHKNLQKIREREQALTIFDEQTRFKTRSFELRIERQARQNVRVQLEDGWLKVFYPEHLNVANAPIQESIRYGIEEAMRLEAKRVLPLKVNQFCRQYGFRVNQVFIKNLKSRWGSCSSVNNINLNLHLMRLPDHLADYVVLHELCHTVEKNHGPGFWRLLDSVCGQRARHLAKEMKQYRTTIY